MAPIVFDNIIFDNKAQIDISQDFILNAKKEANLPPGRILVVLNDGPVDENNELLGICMPNSLFFYSTGEIVFPSYYIGSPFRNRWDCGVALSQKACHWKEQYPAYFTYLLGHEFGHTRVCLQNELLHIHSCLIYDKISDASDHRITQPHKLPHEKLFDQFGIYIATCLYSREELKKDINQMLNEGASTDPERDRNLLFLLDSSNTNNIDLIKLRNDLIDFSIQYKDKLIDLWEQSAQSDDGSLAKLVLNYINNYDELFNYE